MLLFDGIYLISIGFAHNHMFRQSFPIFVSLASVGASAHDFVVAILSLMICTDCSTSAADMVCAVALADPTSN